MNHLVTKAYNQMKNENHPLFKQVSIDIEKDIAILWQVLYFDRKNMDQNLKVLQEKNSVKLAECILNNLDLFEEIFHKALKSEIPENSIKDPQDLTRLDFCDIYKKLLSYYQSQKSPDPKIETMNYYTIMMLEYEISEITRKHNEMIEYARKHNIEF